MSVPASDAPVSKMDRLDRLFTMLVAAACREMGSSTGAGAGAGVGVCVSLLSDGPLMMLAMVGSMRSALREPDASRSSSSEGWGVLEYLLLSVANEKKCLQLMTRLITFFYHIIYVIQKKQST